MPMNNANKRFEVIAEKPVFKGFFGVNELTVRHTLYQGGWSEPLKREVFHRGECVAVILYDAAQDSVVIIEQFRVGALQLNDERAWLLEIVAGAVEPGETPEDVARREAFEESGCDIQALVKINAFFTSPGGTSELLHLYCGKIDSDNVGGFHGVADENEDIAVAVMPFDDVYQLLNDGKIISAIPIIAIQWLYIHREQIRQKWA